MTFSCYYRVSADVLVLVFAHGFTASESFPAQPVCTAPKHSCAQRADAGHSIPRRALCYPRRPKLACVNLTRILFHTSRQVTSRNDVARGQRRSLICRQSRRHRVWYRVFAILGFALCRSHLPTARLRRLDELIKETQDILNDATEGDCLPDWVIVEDVRRRLVNVRADTHIYRRRVYRASNFPKQYGEFFRGLSFSIGRTINEVKSIRMKLVDAIELRRVECTVSLPRQGEIHEIALRPASALPGTTHVTSNTAEGIPSPPSPTPHDQHTPNMNGISATAPSSETHTARVDAREDDTIYVPPSPGRSSTIPPAAGDSGAIYVDEYSWSSQEKELVPDPGRESEEAPSSRIGINDVLRGFHKTLLATRDRRSTHGFAKSSQTSKRRPYRMQ
ncbi:hypothetical protein PLICRDRAFT_454097 [Plicaturopsis crispa FD-325 SS-3]|uniref:Uncharacterized protein n=1 Tax=Plicaturopsis crispa FD-325 SS-3 TaxID=944288 RepID=A0A0C9SK84_PLICR|nr:hypothetical protein PLICRDRAFT_454097 [Plicaturopsis crispa FD-325 SS-3]